MRPKKDGNNEVNNEQIKPAEVPSQNENVAKQLKDSLNENKSSEDDTNCLRNERVIIRHIPKESGSITNTKHIAYGGMMRGAIRIFTVPIIASTGSYYDVLTKKEKACLEKAMHLEDNALSVHKTKENFWENFIVRLTKEDNYLSLSDPIEYIKYKVLLANKDFIASSIEEAEDKPKATYQFVIIRENEELARSRTKMSATMESYKEFGKIEDNIPLMRTIVETIDGKPTSPKINIEFLKTRINNIIQADCRIFLKIVKDPLLNTKVLIKQAIEAGIISNRGSFLYVTETNTPLCNNGEDPTLNVAAKYLNLPKNQELKFSIEGKLKLE